jgi:hypothetical protein
MFVSYVSIEPKETTETNRKKEIGLSTAGTASYAVTTVLLGVGLYFVRITHLRFDEKHATPDLTNPWRGRTKTPASVRTVHAAHTGTIREGNSY